MTKNQQQIEAIKDKDLSLWVETRNSVFEILSCQQSMFCCCGKLATGLHEQNCRKFNENVDKETVNRLKEFSPKIY